MEPNWIFHGQEKPDFVPPECPECELEPVTNLTCEFGPVGLGTGLILNWENPPVTDDGTPTRILVNGVQVATVPSDATSAQIVRASLPPGFFTVDVIHCGGVPAYCAPFCTDADGYILTDCFLALGPIANSFGCGTQEDILGNHIAPSYIGCEYPADGEETQNAVDFLDPENVAIDWHPIVAPPVVGDPGIWRQFEDANPADGDQDMATDTAVGANLYDHMTWLATYVEYTGDGGNFQLCASSDDGIQIWKNDELLHSNNACRGRTLPPADCADIVPFTLDGPEVIRFAMGVWERGGGWGGYFSIQDESGVPIFDGDDDEWIFHGTERPGDVEDFPCTEPQPSIREISCERDGQGGVDVSWTVPEGLTVSIDVSVNGAVIDTVSSTTTTYNVAAGQVGDAEFAQVCVRPIEGASRAACCGIFLGEELYINCGDNEHIDGLGRVWTEDTLANPSPFLSSPNNNVAVWDAYNPELGGAALDRDAVIVAEQFPDEVLASERGNDGPVEYTVAGWPPGEYEVILLFLEGCCAGGCIDEDLDLDGLPDHDPCDTVNLVDDQVPLVDPQFVSSTAGCRVFDILINGDIVKDQFSQNALTACVFGTLPGPDSYGYGLSVVADGVTPVNGTITVLIEDLGAGSPPENASIKGICIRPSGPCVPNPAGEICDNGRDDDCDGLVDGADVDDCDTGGGFIRGDSNADGSRNITDGVCIFSFLFTGGDEPPCKDAADTSDQGAINITSGIYILNHLFLGGPQPPAPFPNCGPDTNLEDPDLGCLFFPPCTPLP